MHGDLKIEDQAAKAGSTHVLTGRYPELGSESIPIEPYISPQYYELEKRYVFKKVWIHVGRVEEIPGAGDYFVKQLDACDASILVVRNRKGRFTRSTTCVRTA